MPFLVSTELPEHPVVQELTATAVGLWMRAGCWASGQRMDGQVPKYMLACFGRGWPRPTAQLVEKGLWIDRGAHYEFGFRGVLWRAPRRKAARRWIPDSVRRAVYARDGWACLWCGTRDDLSLDHIWPYSLGGSDDPDNLQTLCKPCNSSKGIRF